MKEHTLSFESTDFVGDKKAFFVVNFKNINKSFQWYPKWKDVMQILSDTMATEGILNDGEHLDYLLYTIFYILSSRLCLEKVSVDTAKIHHKIASLIQRELLDEKIKKEK